MQDKQTKKSRYFSRLSEYWILSTSLCLSGCMGVYEGGFECPPGKGLGCTSISEVNKVVDQCYRSQWCSVADISEAECNLRELAKPDTIPQIWFNPRFNQFNDYESSCPPKLVKPETRDAKNSI